MKIKQKISVLLIMMTLFSINTYAKDRIGTLKQNMPAYETEVDFKPICYVFKGESFVIGEETDRNYGLILQNNELVYVDKNYVTVEEIKPAAIVKPLAEQQGTYQFNMNELTNRGEEVVEYARNYIGVPYVYGGNSLVTGVDCSGFTKQIYLNFEVDLERTSADQYKKDGIPITREQLRPGDLVFYGYGDLVTHVAIYADNNQVIHSPAPGLGVCISPIWQNGDAPLIGYKRIFI